MRDIGIVRICPNCGNRLVVKGVITIEDAYKEYKCDMCGEVMLPPPILNEGKV